MIYNIKTVAMNSLFALYLKALVSSCNHADPDKIFEPALVEANMRISF